LNLSRVAYCANASLESKWARPNGAQDHSIAKCFLEAKQLISPAYKGGCQFLRLAGKLGVRGAAIGVGRETMTREHNWNRVRNTLNDSERRQFRRSHSRDRVFRVAGNAAIHGATFGRFPALYHSQLGFRRRGIIVMMAGHRHGHPRTMSLVLLGPVAC
jgi:hypothetical protein